MSDVLAALDCADLTEMFEFDVKMNCPSDARHLHCAWFLVRQSSDRLIDMLDKSC